MVQRSKHELRSKPSGRTSETADNPQEHRAALLSRLEKYDDKYKWAVAAKVARHQPAKDALLRKSDRRFDDPLLTISP